MNHCYICKKQTNFNGYVCLSDGEFMDLYLCKSHYMKWCRSKSRLEIEKRFKKAKPQTKEWYKRCKELQKDFDKWMRIELKFRKDKLNETESKV